MGETADEHWRPIPIPGAQGYQASSLGRIRSVTGSAADGRARRGRVLRPWLADRYLVVALGQAAKSSVHRLVASAFHGSPPTPKHEVAHANGNALDNRPENLRWVTHTENEQEKRAHGTYFTRLGKPGEKHHKAKLTDLKVRAIRAAYTGQRGELRHLATQYAVSPSTIGRICDGRLWTHV